MAIENITVTEDSSPATITITDETATAIAVTSLEPAVTLSISTAGEVNTGRNLGTGAGAFKTKTGPILDFRSFTGGTSIDVTEGSTEITVAVGEIEASLIPDQTSVHDLGSTTRRFRDLYLSGTSIDLGGADITSDGTNVSIGGNRILTVADTTDALNEGTTNVYYTDARSRSAVSATGDISYDSSTGVFSYSTPSIPSDVSDLTDTGGLLDRDDLSNNTTTDLAEGTNLYYTTARFDTAFAGKDTDDLTEGSTNQYYTDARSRAAISATGDISYNPTTGVISFTASAPGIALDDLSVTVASAGTANLSYNNSTGVFTYTPPDLSSYLTSYTETDPVFTASAASGIASSDITNWNTAYGWGDHSTQGYLTSYTETDPVFSAHTTSNISNGTGFLVNNGTGTWSYDNSTYLTSYTETDPVFTASPAGGITSTQVTNWDTAYSWGDHSTAGYLTSYTETDPVYTASSWYTTTNNSSNWDTAYSWGDHSLAGYLTSFTETNDLTAAVTWANVPDANITQSSVTQHQAALSITESQISDLAHYTDADVDTHLNTSTATTGQRLTWTGTDYAWQTPASGLELTDFSVTTDPASNGGTLSYDNTTGVFTFAPADLTGASVASAINVVYTAVNKDTVTLAKGTPVYAKSGATSGQTVEVGAADASDPAKMPAIGVLGEQLAADAEGDLLLYGEIQGVDTDTPGFSVGDVIYVAVGGGYTDTPPTGEGNIIQNLGVVSKVHPTNGGGLIEGSGRGAATPNLNDGNIFIGNASNQAVTATLDTSIVPENTNLYWTQTRFDTAFSGKTTSDLTEGSNLYYTDARANTAIDNRVTGTFIEGLDFDADGGTF